MSLPTTENKEQNYSQARNYSKDLIKQYHLTENQMLRVLSDLDPTAGDAVREEITSQENPQAAQYFRDQGMVEFFLSSSLADAIVFPGRLGKLPPTEKDKITQISGRRPRHKRQTVISNTQSAHSPPRLA